MIGLENFQLNHAATRLYLFTSPATSAFITSKYYLLSLHRSLNILDRTLQAPFANHRLQIIVTGLSDLL